MSSYIDVTAAIKVAESVLEEKYEVLQRLDIVRRDLRNAATMGAGTAEQRAWIAETFPVKGSGQHAQGPQTKDDVKSKVTP